MSIQGAVLKKMVAFTFKHRGIVFKIVGVIPRGLQKSISKFVIKKGLKKGAKVAVVAVGGGLLKFVKDNKEVIWTKIIQGKNGELELVECEEPKSYDKGEERGKTLYCKKCGQPITNDSVYCTYCGTKQG